MTMSNVSEDLVPSRVAFLEGQGGMPMLKVTTAWSTAEVYMHGAHVTHFQRRDESPLLFLSERSHFEPGDPIRGGIPVIFPWFGARDGAGMHGYARLKPWDIKEISPGPDGSISVRFHLPNCPESQAYPAFNADYLVTFGEALTLELIVANKSGDSAFEFEQCLHTYFAVGDVRDAGVVGLKGLSYLDKVANFVKKTETNDAIGISSEVDRVYLDATGSVEIHDRRLGRTISIEKEHSASTVVWNPWIAKAQQMHDFGPNEYLKMVCVESGNVNVNKTVLPAGKTSNMKVTLSTKPA